MKNSVVLIAIGISFATSLMGQSAGSARKKILPNFDIRDHRSGADEAATSQMPDRTMVEGRKANVASFLTSPEGLRSGTRLVLNEYGLPKIYRRDGQPLAGPSSQDPEVIARNFLRARQNIFALNSSEVDQMRIVVKDVTDTAVFLAFNQTINGIDVFNGQIKFTLNGQGEVIQVGTGELVPGLQLSAAPKLSIDKAVGAAFVAIGLLAPKSLAPLPAANGKTSFANPTAGNYSPITADLTIFPMTATSARLAYRVFLEVGPQSWYEMLIDAQTGSLLFRHNLYVFSGQARVWTQSPLVGARVLATFPDPSNADPAGWLPQTATVTTGNNVDAYLDANGDDEPDSTSGSLQNGRAYSANQVFDFPFGDGTVQQNPRLTQAASVTNIFYLINVAHDYYYGLGFNENAGNFQTDNFGRGGIGNDAVLAEAQYGGFTDNAAFAPTPEGMAPRIRMGLFTLGTAALTDDLDSDYDGQTVLHEYGHGVSNRLVGAKISTSCLSNIQSGAMGEGWSDYFAISYFNNPVFGAYESQNTVHGIRRQSYQGYTYTYEDIGNGANGYEVHDDGEIWAATLWDLRQGLGSTVTDRLVLDGLRSTPCNPSMTDARDAIFTADQVDNGGANRTMLWTVFARHGLGNSALGADGDSLSGTRYDASYDLPSDLQATLNPAITSNPLGLQAALGKAYTYNIVASNPAQGVLNFALNSGPSGMLVDPTTGSVSWIPSFVSPRVKITVTDGRGGKVVHGYLLPIDTPLTSGSPLTIAGDENSVGFANITLPANTPALQVRLNGGSGDADLLVVDPDGYLEGDSENDGNTETVTIANPEAGQWLVFVEGYATYAGVNLTATQLVPPVLSPNGTISGLSDVVGGESLYRVTIPSGAASLSISTTGGTGDEDLFVRYGFPAVCSYWADEDCLEDEYSDNNGNGETINIGNPAPGDWYIDLSAYAAYSGVTLTTTTTFPALTLLAGGAATTSTTGASSSISTGYATASVAGTPAPFGTAVFSFSENGYIVSEAGIPTSPPTLDARIFIDYRTGVTSGIGSLNIDTGLAIANPGTSAANVTFTLRDRNAQILATGHGSLGAGQHSSKFLHELGQIAPDFNPPANFPTATMYGSLEISSSQPVSVLALRLTTNQRGETLLTSTPVADLSRTVNSTPVYFPQLADGGGYTTTLILLNTSAAVEAGTIALFDDTGAPLSLGTTGGTTGSSFSYSIPAAGAFVLQTNGSPALVHTGSVQVTPASGNISPVGAGVFSYSPQGILVTESGIPSATPTTHARFYVDKSSGHDTGLALANPGMTAGTVNLQIFKTDGVTSVGSTTKPISLAVNGHDAAFVSELIAGLPAGFTGVAELTSPSPIVALTLRTLVNGRGDSLLTTFPIADANQPAPTPIVFPDIADGAGYTTQFIFISPTGIVSVNLNFIGDDGTPLYVGRTTP